MKDRMAQCKTCKKPMRRRDLNKIQNALICENCQPSLFVEKPVTNVNK